MKGWYLVIDVEKCEDCKNCFLSCKDEFVDNDWPCYSAPMPDHGQSWIVTEGKERGQYPFVDVAYLPSLCMHCDNPPCINAAANGACYKRSDGIVLIDPLKAKGQEELVKACPYGAIRWNEALKLPQKCTFCAHLLDSGWEQTRCVQSCPTGALSSPQSGKGRDRGSEETKAWRSTVRAWYAPPCVLQESPPFHPLLHRREHCVPHQRSGRVCGRRPCGAL